jgi:hypothetical protein
MNIVKEVSKIKRKIIQETENWDWDNKEEASRFHLIDACIQYEELEDIFVKAYQIIANNKSKRFAFIDFSFPHSQLLQILNVMEKYAKNKAFL